jgi:hypothetical protein
MTGHRHVSLTTALILTISALLTAAKEPAPSLEVRFPSVSGSYSPDGPPTLSKRANFLLKNPGR